ncbi:glycosyltransferase family 1 protein [Polaribacter vadi]|uniref:Glycosyl transferase family 1 n=1 Tax=Polaribacter vadi TaxID=1774273 RepID=A0A1B8TZ89_9FLAO|nr:glycosyltransferase family 4 protein [Polaribacter vadi]AOW17235.1 glycosyltransferase family 1 protein [Polaribacter vadi]OBY64839.1 glycosyl transferase family 1 [Polaribacter vadi]
MVRKLIRITTVPISLDKLIDGQLSFMVGNNFEVIGISSGGDKLVEVGHKEGVRVVPIEMTRKITPIKDIKAVFKLYKLLKREKPLIVHTHTPKAGIVGMLASYLAKVPNRLHTVAGLPLLEATGVKRKVLNFVEKLTYSCATKVYPNSFGLKKIIVDNKLSKSDKLKVIANGSSNGIDTSYFNPTLFLESTKQKLKEDLNIFENDFVFIFVGRVVADKGVNELVAAFEMLSKETESIKLLIVGPFEEELDPLNEKTKALIKANKKIISVGYQNDVRLYFSISDALVFPSYREGFPNVVLQAGAMNLPSIVSNINGCNEIIEENINGYIIPVKNEVALYNAMGSLIKDDKMKLNAREMITSRFEQKVVWEALLDEYKILDNNV